MNPWVRFSERARKLWGPKARERYEKAKVYRNRAVRRAERKRGPRADRLSARVAAGYPGDEVRNTRGKLMGRSAKESPEARAVRRARGVGRG